MSDMSDTVAKLVFSEVYEKEVGVGITYIVKQEMNREQVFAVPIPLNVAERIASQILSPVKPTIRAFAPSGSLIGNWAFNGEIAPMAAEKKARKTRAQTSGKQEKPKDPIKVEVRLQSGEKHLLAFDSAAEAAANIKSLLRSDAMYKSASIYRAKSVQTITRAELIADENKGYTASQESKDKKKRFAKTPVSHKKQAPFGGGKCLKWQGRAHQTRAEFSRG